MVQLDEQEIEKIITFLKVMAGSRCRILGLLSEREYTVKELAAALGLTEPTISAHLRLLREHDMVEMRPEGTSHFYRMADTELEGGAHYRMRQDSIFSLLKALSEKLPKEATEETNPDEFERNVLNHFFRNGKLTEIPTSAKKQLVVLRRLAQEFAPGERYPEKQVNEILKRFHPDCASLRRYLVDNGMLARAKSVYWRPAA